MIQRGDHYHTANDTDSFHEYMISKKSINHYCKRIRIKLISWVTELLCQTVVVVSVSVLSSVGHD